MSGNSILAFRKLFLGVIKRTKVVIAQTACTIRCLNDSVTGFIVGLNNDIYATNRCICRVLIGLNLLSVCISKHLSIRSKLCVVPFNACVVTALAVRTSYEIVISLNSFIVSCNQYYIFVVIASERGFLGSGNSIQRSEIIIILSNDFQQR